MQSVNSCVLPLLLVFRIHIIKACRKRKSAPLGTLLFFMAHPLVVIGITNVPAALFADSTASNNVFRSSTGMATARAGMLTTSFTHYILLGTCSKVKISRAIPNLKPRSAGHAALVPRPVHLHLRRVLFQKRPEKFVEKRCKSPQDKPRYQKVYGCEDVKAENIETGIKNQVEESGGDRYPREKVRPSQSCKMCTLRHIQTCSTGHLPSGEIPRT